MKIRFSNFKSFYGVHQIDLAKLNVIIGKNNAGKSSLSDLIYYYYRFYHDVQDHEIAHLDESNFLTLINMDWLRNLQIDKKVLGSGAPFHDQKHKIRGDNEKILLNQFSLRKDLSKVDFGEQRLFDFPSLNADIFSPFDSIINGMKSMPIFSSSNNHYNFLGQESIFMFYDFNDHEDVRRWYSQRKHKEIPLREEISAHEPSQYIDKPHPITGKKYKRWIDEPHQRLIENDIAGKGTSEIIIGENEVSHLEYFRTNKKAREEEFKAYILGHDFIPMSLSFSLVPGDKNQPRMVHPYLKMNGPTRIDDIINVYIKNFHLQFENASKGNKNRYPEKGRVYIATAFGKDFNSIGFDSRNFLDGLVLSKRKRSDKNDVTEHIARLDNHSGSSHAIALTLSSLVDIVFKKHMEQIALLNKKYLTEKKLLPKETMKEVFGDDKGFSNINTFSRFMFDNVSRYRYKISSPFFDSRIRPVGKVTLNQQDWAIVRQLESLIKQKKIPEISKKEFDKIHRQLLFAHFYDMNTDDSNASWTVKVPYNQKWNRKGPQRATHAKHSFMNSPYLNSYRSYSYSKNSNPLVKNFFPKIVPLGAITSYYSDSFYDPVTDLYGLKFKDEKKAVSFGTFYPHISSHSHNNLSWLSGYEDCFLGDCGLGSPKETERKLYGMPMLARVDIDAHKELDNHQMIETEDLSQFCSNYDSVQLVRKKRSGKWTSKSSTHPMVSENFCIQNAVGYETHTKGTDSDYSSTFYSKEFKKYIPIVDQVYLDKVNAHRAAIKLLKDTGNDSIFKYISQHAFERGKVVLNSSLAKNKVISAENMKGLLQSDGSGHSFVSMSLLSVYAETFKEAISEIDFSVKKTYKKFKKKYAKKHNMSLKAVDHEISVIYLYILKKLIQQFSKYSYDIFYRNYLKEAHQYLEENIEKLIFKDDPDPRNPIFNVQIINPVTYDPKKTFLRGDSSSSENYILNLRDIENILGKDFNRVLKADLKKTSDSKLSKLFQNFDTNTGGIIHNINQSLAALDMGFQLELIPVELKGMDFQNQFRLISRGSNWKRDADSFSLGITSSSFDLPDDDKRLDLFNTGQGNSSIISILSRIHSSRLSYMHKSPGEIGNPWSKKYSDICIIREPENHLHPNVVAKLTDHLFDLSFFEDIDPFINESLPKHRELPIFSNNVYFIIETHSEVVIRQLQSSAKKYFENSNPLYKNKDEKKGSVPKVYYIDEKKVDSKKTFGKEYFKDNQDLYRLLGSMKTSGYTTSFIKDLELKENGFLGKSIPKGFFDVNTDLITDLWKPVTKPIKRKRSKITKKRKAK